MLQKHPDGRQGAELQARSEWVLNIICHRDKVTGIRIKKC